MLFSTKPSILIIDDDKAILNVFKRIFQRRGYCVAVAEGGKEAAEKISMNHYDVALIDLCLPDMEGTALFPLIQSTSPHTVKIMLSGKAYLKDSIKGADVFLQKPIAVDQLLSIIDSKLQTQNIEAEPFRKEKD